ncbi:MAG: uroporphyrinogen-III synthase [Candidatus Tectimicrobiota bacterium]
MPSLSPMPQETRSRSPLHGKRVLVTRARPQASTLVACLQERGAIPVVFPVIHIVPPTDNYAALDAALRQLASFDWAVFTSVNGVEHVWQRLRLLGLSPQALASVRLAAIGPATAEALQVRGLQPEVVPSQYVAEALLSAIPQPAGQRFLLARADLARDTLRLGLQEAGAEAVEVAAYSTVLAALSAETLQALEAGIDIITFTSSSTVRNFVEQVGLARAQALVAQAQVVTIGPITAATATELGIRVDVMAAEYTIAGLLTALETRL